VERIGDIELHVTETPLDDRDQIGVLMDAFRAQHKRAISVLYTMGGRPGIHVAVTDDLVSQGVKAGAIAGALAATTGGKGGGRPHFASAGVGDPTLLGSTLANTSRIVRSLLKP
jgi:alanyl-tRNA synthetase